MSNHPECNEEFEVFDLPEENEITHRPVTIVLPPPSAISHKNDHHYQARRRWRLLRCAIRLQRQMNSLTHREKVFLEKLHKDETEENDTVQIPPLPQNALEINNGDATKYVRERLRQKVANRAKSMTDKESRFILGLIKEDCLTSEELHHVHEVLENDPLYHKENHTISIQGGKEIVRNRHADLLKESCFLKELWKRCHPLSESRSSNEFHRVLYKSESMVNGSQKKGNPELSLDNVVDVTHDSSHTFERFHQYMETNLPTPCGSCKSYASDSSEGIDECETSDDENDESSIDETRTFSILSQCVSDLLESPLVLTPPLMDALRTHLPWALQHDNFWLKYSLGRDGASTRVLMDKIRSSCRTLVAIETTDGRVFGSFTSSPWRPHGNCFYGTGESFLWRLRKSRLPPAQTIEEITLLEQDVEVFTWSGRNRNVQMSARTDSDLIIGGVGDENGVGSSIDKDFGSALTILQNLEQGFTDKCHTFDSPPLVEGGVFEIANIDCWTLTPVESITVAERLELSRQFVFDHGGFVNS